jgi:hypothetical protein
MDYASPASSLMGLITSIAIGLVLIAASALLLKERSAGPWLMLLGSIATLVGKSTPQTIRLIMDAADSVEGVSPAIEDLMYKSVWAWLAVLGGIFFALGLLLIAIRRRRLEARIKELETIVERRSQPGN